MRQGLRPHPEDLQPAPRAPAHEAHQPPQGPRRGPRLRAGRLGRGARRDRRPHARHPLPGARRRVRISAARGELRRRRHPYPVHGDPARLPLRLGADRHGVRGGAGREVLPQRAPVRRAVAPRVHRGARHPALPLRHQLRQQRGGLGRGRRGMAPGGRSGARAQARAGRAASVRHRGGVGGVGSDPAEDRRGVPLRAAPPHRARARVARGVRRRVPRGLHQRPLPGRAQRLLPPRTDEPKAPALGCRGGSGGPLRRDGRAASGPRWSPGCGWRGRGAGRRGVVARGGGGSSRVPALPRPRARAHPGVGGSRERRAGGNHPPHRRRVPRPRLRRRDHRDRGPRAAASARSRCSSARA